MSRYQEVTALVIGLGSIGNRHLNNLRKLGVGRCIVNRRAGSTNHQFTTPDKVDCFVALEDALAAKPDVAIICNPTHLHVDAAEQCIQSGVHVLIEKPLSDEIGRREIALEQHLNTSSVHAAMAYCMRYHPAYRQAHDWVRSGSIGKCLYAKAWFEGFLPAWHPWEDYRESYAARDSMGGGVLRTLDHELDFLNWVLGPAVSSEGVAWNSGSIGIESNDAAIYQLEHPNGVRSSVVTAFCRFRQSRGFEFVGQQGIIQFSMETGTLSLSTNSEEETSQSIAFDTYDINQMYVDLLNDFLQVTLGGSSKVLPEISSGVHAMKSIDSITKQPKETM